MPSNAKRWTAMEDNILYTSQHLPLKKVEEMLDGRTIGAIKARLNRLEITRRAEPIDPWTPEEDKALRLWFKVLGLVTIQERYLPNRTAVAIYNRAQRLGLTERACKVPKEDIDLIVQLFMDPELPSSTIAKKFDLDPSHCHRLAWRYLEKYKNRGLITEEQYLRTLVLRTSSAKNKAVYLDRLVDLVASNAKKEESVC